MWTKLSHVSASHHFPRSDDLPNAVSLALAEVLRAWQVLNT